MKHFIRITLIIILSVVTIVYGYGSYFDRGDYDNRLGDIILSSDEAEIVWFNLDTPLYKDATDINSVSIRASESLEETYYMRWPVDKGEPNSVLATPGVTNSQLFWMIVDSNLIPEPNTIALPNRRPWRIMYADANEFPLCQDPNLTFYRPESALGIGLYNISGDIEDVNANNYIQVYSLLDFEPNLLNVTIGRGVDDIATGPNNVTIGNSAGYSLSLGERNTFGGNFSGQSVAVRDDDTFYGFESGKNVGGGAYTVSGDYKYTYFSEGSGYLWGVPLGNATVASLDVDGVARNVGGGIVGLPFTGHPFQVGDVIDIRGTTYYEGNQTLTAGTTANELQFSDTYAAETFEGTERVVKYLDLNTYGGSLGGIAGQNINGILYYPIYDVTGSNWILIIQPDGTMAMDTFSWPKSYNGARDCILSGDNDYLYVKTSGTTDIIKFNISTGAVEWYMDTTTLRADPLMDYASALFRDLPTMGLDSNGNVYAVIEYTGLGKPIVQLDAGDGSLNYIYTDSGQIDTADVSVSKFGTYVDNEQGIFLSGGQSSCLTTKFAAQDAAGNMNNLWVRTLDNSAGDKMRVGGTYASAGITYTDFVACNHIVKHKGYFYILICDYAPDHAVYKYEWTGTEMSLVATIDFAGHMPPEACGIFFDLYDNMVIVNNCPTHGFGDGTFWYFDKYGNYITTISGFNPLMLDWWNATSGWSYQRGNVIFYPGINPDYISVGKSNTAIGSQALRGNDYGAEPNDATAVGYKSLYSVTIPNKTTAYGVYSGYNITTADRGIYLGPYAGYNQTNLDQMFILDSRQRESVADESVSSLFYGYIAADANDSWLNINADVNIPAPHVLDVNRIDVKDVNIIGLTANSIIFVDPNGNISDDSQDNANFYFIDSNDTLFISHLEAFTDANSPKYYVGDSDTFITQDGSDNMTFTDAIVGTKTLKELGSPTYIYIAATAQNEGDLHLSDGTNWNVSKSMIKSIRVMTSSTDWDMYLCFNDDGQGAATSTIPEIQIVNSINGNANLSWEIPYHDEDDSGEVHITYIDNSGANTADIYIIGYQMI